MLADVLTHVKLKCYLHMSLSGHVSGLRTLDSFEPNSNTNGDGKARHAQASKKKKNRVVFRDLDNP